MGRRASYANRSKWDNVLSSFWPTLLSVEKSGNTKSLGPAASRVTNNALDFTCQQATRPSWTRYLSLRRLPARTFILRIAQTPYRVSCVTPSETGMDTPSYDDKSSLTSEIF